MRKSCPRSPERRSRSAAAVATAGLVLLVLLGCTRQTAAPADPSVDRPGAPAPASSAPSPSKFRSPSASPTPSATPAAGATYAFVGDMACATHDSAFNDGKGSGDRCRQMAVSDLLRTDRIGKLVSLGDNQYQDGELRQFKASYDPSYGRVKGKTLPTCGNHEYRDSGGRGYESYFGRSCKWYTALLGPGVRVILLDTNVGMDPGSAQYAFVRDTLESSREKCVFLAGHHPRYSVGKHGNNGSVDPIWDLGVRSGASAMFSGHDHNGQRWAPQGADSGEKAGGLVQFVSGAGGKNIYAKRSSDPANRKYIGVFGLYEVTPDPSAGTFDYVYRGIDGKVHDKGQESCRR